MKREEQRHQAEKAASGAPSLKQTEPKMAATARFSYKEM